MPMIRGSRRGPILHGKPPDWFDTQWKYRRRITIDNSGGADLIQYPVEIVLDSSDWPFGKCEPDGSDIRVTDESGQRLIPYYLHEYDSVTETGSIWIRVHYVASGDADAFVYAYYGNASPTAFQIPPTGTFTRPSSAQSITGIPENIVYDSVTDKYYIPYIPDDDGPIKLASSATPGGSYSDEGTILDYGAPDAWDDEGLHSPHLIKEGSTWYLFYTGGPDVANSNLQQIGLATASSITGTYTRDGGNPILSYGGGGDWDEFRVGEPYVYYSNILSKWVMHFMGDAGSGPASEIELIGYATADTIDGTYTKYVNNPIMNLGTAPSYDDGIIADPWCYELDGVAYIGYTCGPAQDAPWYAAVVTTTDYINFRKSGVVYGVGVEGEWDEDGILRGAWSYFDGTYYFPYANSAVGAWGIASMPGQSTAAGFDPMSVLDYYDHFPGSSLDAAKWGTPSSRAAGSVVVSNSEVSLTVTSGTDAIRMLQGYRPFGRDYLAEFRVKHVTADGGATDAGEIGFMRADLNAYSRIFDYDNANWKMDSADTISSTVLAMAQAIHTNYLIQRINWISSSSIKYQNDDNSWEEITTNIHTAPLKPAMMAFRGSQNCQLDVDYVIVRKYIGSDPGVIIGRARTQ